MGARHERASRGYKAVIGRLRPSIVSIGDDYGRFRRCDRSADDDSFK